MEVEDDISRTTITNTASEAKYTPAKSVVAKSSEDKHKFNPVETLAKVSFHPLKLQIIIQLSTMSAFPDHQDVSFQESPSAHFLRQKEHPGLHPAVSDLIKTSSFSAKVHGESSEECGEVYLCYGKVLLVHSASEWGTIHTISEISSIPKAATVFLNYSSVITLK